MEKEYLLGPSGEQISVLDGSGSWLWTNVYAGARQLATYDSAGTHFTVTDWLGTKRMQLGVTAASTVTVGEQCTSLPYGDGLNCSGSDVNHLYFTGKERDTESGNDYFLARYYSSNMGGRFLTPDWSKNPQGVPYANYSNPQSLNLYAYVADNPQSLADLDGHQCTDITNGPCKLAQAAKKNSDAAQQQGAVANKAPAAERIALGVEAAANVVVGVPKPVEGAGSLVVGTLGSETGVGLGVAAAGAYELTQGSGQLTSALLQGSSAITGDTTGVEDKTDQISATTSIAGRVGTKLNHGNYHAGAKYAAAEGVFSGALTGDLVKGATDIIDTIMNLKDLLTP